MPVIGTVGPGLVVHRAENDEDEGVGHVHHHYFA
jgi:hypothetical protein